MTGVADAYLDGAPLVAITGQVGTDRMQLTSHQYLDLTAMFEPITKRSKQIIRPDTVGEIVRLAFKHAEKGKPGATHIDLPQNIAKMPAVEVVGDISESIYEILRCDPHTGRSLPADGAQRDRSPCGLQRKHEAFCPPEGGIPAKRDLSLARIAKHPRQRLQLPGVFFL